MPELFGHTRAHVAARHALITPHNHVNSVVPGITGAATVILINPAMGARFAQLLVTFQAGGQAAFPAGQGQVFGYLQSGAATVTIGNQKVKAAAGWYFFAPAGSACSLTEVVADTRVTLFQKNYSPLPGVPAPARSSPMPLRSRVRRSSVIRLPTCRHSYPTRRPSTWP